ncbi:hypothetical protein OG739_26295 [Streptomyces longwoodensis]|uniref:hypothetical protein n=1 Tax=Streptomyces longwoodensis TaxID=68231 RepID=UPI003250F1A5
MLALRLTHSARPAVQLRRLLVAAASAGTGFLLLSTLGYALGHPWASTASLLRLAWCAVPLAATAHLATAVARTDPGTRPRPGLAAIGLGPARLMAVSATTTALSSVLGSLLALLVFLHLRGDLTGLPFDGVRWEFLAPDQSLPLPGALTLLSLTPLTCSVAVALMLRPRDTRLATRAATRTLGRVGRQAAKAAGGRGSAPERGGDGHPGGSPTPGGAGGHTDAPPAPDAAGGQGDAPHGTAGADRPHPVAVNGSRPAEGDALPATGPGPAEADARLNGAAPRPAPPGPNPTALPWGAALLAAGLAVEAYTGGGATAAGLRLPGGLHGPGATLLGWALTALGLALAGPGLTHLCGRLLQSAQPGAVRLLAGRGLMEEATRIGRPVGVLCAVASGGYAMDTLGTDSAGAGPLTVLGGLVVAGCALATLGTAAVEARQARAETTAALLRLGAPATALRGAAALRAGALLAVFVPLTVLVAELASLPLAG